MENKPVKITLLEVKALACDAMNVEPLNIDEIAGISRFLDGITALIENRCRANE